MFEILLAIIAPFEAPITVIFFDLIPNLTKLSISLETLLAY